MIKITALYIMSYQRTNSNASDSSDKDSIASNSNIYDN